MRRGFLAAAAALLLLTGCHEYWGGGSSGSSESWGTATATYDPTADDQEAQLIMAAFQQGLQELGWIIGRNLRPVIPLTSRPRNQSSPDPRPR